MTQGNRAAIHIHFTVIDPKVFLPSKDHRSKRLIHLKDINILQGKARTLEHFTRRRNWTF